MIRNVKYMLRAWADKFRKISTGETGSLIGRDQYISANLSSNLELVEKKLGNSADLVIREFNVGKTRAALVCIDGLVDKDTINSHILQPLLIYTRMTEPQPGKNEILNFIKNNTVTVLNVHEVRSLGKLLDMILTGHTGLLVDGQAIALMVETIGYEAREVSEPETEHVVRGPREGFTERLKVNDTLLRRKIRSPNLRLEKMTLGRVTKTEIRIAYIEGIANDKIVDEVRRRLERIEIDGVMESGYIEAFIEDAPLSMFPTVGNTEKPDIVAARLLEGRVAILVDGTPIALTVPRLFIETIQASEDYYSSWFSGSISRWLRLVSLIFTNLLPAFYVAAVSFNPEVLPTILMLTIAASREGIPFPTIFEMLMMGIIFEILREAGVRQPRPVGQAVSIVGVLVIGQAAIMAGIVSAPAVMVVALTGISSFAVPALSEVYIIVRFFLVILTGIAGFFGLFLGIVILLTHMVSLRSFGVPYMSPMGPANFSNWKDFFIRVPWWAMSNRPGIINWKNQRRVATSMPGPPRNEDQKPLSKRR